MEILPKASPLCPNNKTTAHEPARRPGRRRGGGGGSEPTCLDQHDCDGLESEVASPFQAVTLPFLLALIPCLPALVGCLAGISLCRDGRHVPRLGYDGGYVAAPRGTSTHAASSPVTAARPVAATAGESAVNPYPTATRAQVQAQAAAPRDYRSPREETIGL